MCSKTDSTEEKLKNRKKIKLVKELTQRGHRAGGGRQRGRPWQRPRVKPRDHPYRQLCRGLDQTSCTRSLSDTC